MLTGEVSNLKESENFQKALGVSNGDFQSGVTVSNSIPSFFPEYAFWEVAHEMAARECCGPCSKVVGRFFMGEKW